MATFAIATVAAAIGFMGWVPSKSGRKWIDRLNYEGRHHLKANEKWYYASTPDSVRAALAAA